MDQRPSREVLENTGTYPHDLERGKVVVDGGAERNNH